MHTEFGKTPKASEQEDLNSKLYSKILYPKSHEEQESLNTEKAPKVRSTLPIDSWISHLSFKQFYYLDNDFSSFEVLKVHGYLKKRVKYDIEYDGNVRYFCLDFLKRALKNAEFFETLIENERSDKHRKQRREEFKQELWQNVKNKFQLKFLKITKASS